MTVFILVPGTGYPVLYCVCPGSPRCLFTGTVQRKKNRTVFGLKKAVLLDDADPLLLRLATIDPNFYCICKLPPVSFYFLPKDRRVERRDGRIFAFALERDRFLVLI